MWKIAAQGTPLVAALVLAASLSAAGQTHGEPEAFTATAIVSNNLGSGAGRVEIQVTRWSTEGERTQLVNTLLQKGPRALLAALQEQRSVGRIRTPDSLGYDLRYAQQTPGDEGSRRIVLATDRPIGFWEAVERPRTIDYPFTIIQMQIDRDGRGRGTLSLFTKVLAHDGILELENFATSPVMLTEIQARPLRD